MSKFSKYAKVLSYLYDILAGCAALIALLITVNFEWTINIAAKVIAMLKGPGSAYVSESDLLKIKYVLGIHTFVWVYVKMLFWRVESSKKEILSAVDKKIADFRADSVRRLLASCGVLRGKPLEVRNCSVQGAISELLTVVTKYMHNWHVHIKSAYSTNDSGISTKYYVYTLSASHERDDLKIMVKYLSAVIDRILSFGKYNWYDESSSTRHVPVLVVPQNRNVILAESVADKIKIDAENQIEIPILAYQPPPKGEKDDSGSVDDVDIGYERFYRIFQGCDALRRKLHMLKICDETSVSIKKFVLHMILIDCNVTRGTSMVNIIRDIRMDGGFNAFVKKNAAVIGRNLCPEEGVGVEFDNMRDCATLFVASDRALSDEDGSLDRKFRTEKLRLWYYFVLPESVKEKLWNMRLNCHENYNAYKFDDALGVDLKDRLKKFTGIDNGWINIKARSTEEFIQCLQ